MTAGKCPKCGNEYKNIGNHRCKAKNQEDTQKDTKDISIPDITDTNSIESAMTPEALTQPVIAEKNVHSGVECLFSETVEEVSRKDAGTHTESAKEEPKQSFLSRIFGSKKKANVEVSSPENLIEGMKPYQIPSKSPKDGFVGRMFHKDQDYIQVVLVSEIIEPKTFWAEKTGMNYISFKDRMFKLPRDIKGNVFFWHIDKQQSLIGTSDATQDDAEDSMHMQRVANQYYALGREVGAPELMGNLRLILLAIGFSILLGVGIAVYISTVKKAIDTNDAYMIQMLQQINSSRSP